MIGIDTSQNTLDAEALIRLPKKMKQDARIQALKKGKSLSGVVRELLTKWLESQLDADKG